MTPIKTLEDYHKEESAKGDVSGICQIEWCKWHQQLHPKSTFRFRDDSRHSRIECRLRKNEQRRKRSLECKIWENEQRRNREKSQRDREREMRERIKNSPLQRLICSEW